MNKLVITPPATYPPIGSPPKTYPPTISPFTGYLPLFITMVVQP